MKKNQCISVNTLYEKYGDHLTYCAISTENDDEKVWYDLVDKRNRGILCMDGESCEVLLENENIVVLQNDGITFCLTKEEYSVAAFGSQSSSAMGVGIGDILYVPSEIIRAVIPYKVTKIHENDGNCIFEAESEDPDKITFDPVKQIPASQIGKSAFLDRDAAVCSLKFYQEQLESEKPKRVQAALLPEGWVWVMYVDGSGCLKSPDKERFCEYDRFTGEYKITSDTHWIYAPERLNNLQDFRSWAESRILPIILKKTKKGE